MATMAPKAKANKRYRETLNSGACQKIKSRLTGCGLRTAKNIPTNKKKRRTNAKTTRENHLSIQHLQDEYWRHYAVILNRFRAKKSN